MAGAFAALAGALAGCLAALRRWGPPASADVGHGERGVWVGGGGISSPGRGGALPHAPCIVHSIACCGIVTGCPTRHPSSGSQAHLGQWCQRPLLGYCLLPPLPLPRRPWTRAWGAGGRQGACRPSRAGGTLCGRCRWRWCPCRVPGRAGARRAGLWARGWGTKGAGLDGQREGRPSVGTSGLAHEPRCTAYLFTSNPHCLQVKPLEDVGSMRHSWMEHILLERYWGWQGRGGGT